MSEQTNLNIKRVLYAAVLNRMVAELSELEAKEVLITNVPAYITSAEHDHAEHVKELHRILERKVELQSIIKDVRTAYFTNMPAQGHVKDDKKDS